MAGTWADAPMERADKPGGSSGSDWAAYAGALGQGIGLLQSQLDRTTDAAQRAALQNQLNAAQTELQRAERERQASEALALARAPAASTGTIWGLPAPVVYIGGAAAVGGFLWWLTRSKRRG